MICKGMRIISKEGAVAEVNNVRVVIRREYKIKMPDDDPAWISASDLHALIGQTPKRPGRFGLKASKKGELEVIKTTIAERTMVVRLRHLPSDLLGAWLTLAQLAQAEVKLDTTMPQRTVWAGKRLSPLVPLLDQGGAVDDQSGEIGELEQDEKQEDEAGENENSEA